MQKVKVIPVSGNCPHKERERLIREADERGKAELRLEQVKMKFNKDCTYAKLATTKTS